MVEAFPRSANTYVTAILEHSNPELTLAHHLHSSQSVIEGVSRSLPVLVLFREPGAAAVSLAQKSGLSIASGLREYVAFYSSIFPHLGATLLMDFNEVISDPAAVIRGLTRRFSLRLQAYTASEAEERAVRGIVLERHVRRHGNLRPSQLALPTREKAASRDALDDELRRVYSEHDLATGVYESLRAISLGRNPGFQP